MSGIVSGALTPSDNSGASSMLASAGDDPRMIAEVTVTAIRPPQDLVRVSWFQFAVGMINNVTYAGFVRNTYEIQNGEAFLRVNPDRSTNDMIYAIGPSIDGPGSAGSKFILNSRWKNWQNYMSKRGWTIETIERAINFGESLPHSGANFLNPGNPMKRIIDPISGKSLILDEVTNEVIQLDGKGFQF